MRGYEDKKRRAGELRRLVFISMSKVTTILCLFLGVVSMALLTAIFIQLQFNRNGSSIEVGQYSRQLFRSDSSGDNPISSKTTIVGSVLLAEASGNSAISEAKGTNAVRYYDDATDEKNPAKKIATHPNPNPFEKFVREHERNYDGREEYDRRRRTFYGNLARIRNHNANANFEKGDSQTKWRMGINHFADRLPTELPLGLVKSALHNKNQLLEATAIFPQTISKSSVSSSEKIAPLPDSVDWRTKGVTTPVKNQGHCGSCWAFATTAALESHLAIQTGKLLELSVEELVACAPNPNHCGGTGGCNGNIAELAYEFVILNKGIVSEWEWGYTSGTNGTVPACNLPNSTHLRHRKPVAAIKGYKNLRRNNYDDLLEAVATIGPIAVNVAATNWHWYESGIFDDDFFPDGKTTERDINHLVVVEGYGSEVINEEPHDYWLVRNSWGPLWGEDGYIRVRRSRDDPKNNCLPDVTPADGIACVGPNNQTIPPDVQVCGVSGILYDAVYPTGVHLVDKSLSTRQQTAQVGVVTE